VLEFVLLKSLIPAKENVGLRDGGKGNKKEREKEKEAVPFQGPILLSFCGLQIFYSNHNFHMKS